MGKNGKGNSIATGGFNSIGSKYSFGKNNEIDALLAGVKAKAGISQPQEPEWNNDTRNVKSVSKTDELIATIWKKLAPTRTDAQRDEVLDEFFKTKDFDEIYAIARSMSDRIIEKKLYLATSPGQLNEFERARSILLYAVYASELYVENEEFMAASVKYEVEGSLYRVISDALVPETPDYQFVGQVFDSLAAQMNQGTCRRLVYESGQAESAEQSSGMSPDDLRYCISTIDLFTATGDHNNGFSLRRLTESAFVLEPHQIIIDSIATMQRAVMNAKDFLHQAIGDSFANNQDRTFIIAGRILSLPIHNLNRKGFNPSIHLQTEAGRNLYKNILAYQTEVLEMLAEESRAEESVAFIASLETIVLFRWMNIVQDTSLISSAERESLRDRLNLYLNGYTGEQALKIFNFINNFDSTYEIFYSNIDTRIEKLSTRNHLSIVSNEIDRVLKLTMDTISEKYDEILGLLPENLEFTTTVDGLSLARLIGISEVRIYRDVTSKPGETVLGVIIVAEDGVKTRMYYTKSDIGYLGREKYNEYTKELQLKSPLAIAVVDYLVFSIIETQELKELFVDEVFKLRNRVDTILKRFDISATDGISEKSSKLPVFTFFDINELLNDNVDIETVDRIHRLIDARHSLSSILARLQGMISMEALELEIGIVTEGIKSEYSVEKLEQLPGIDSIDPETAEVSVIEPQYSREFLRINEGKKYIVGNAYSTSEGIVALTASYISPLFKYIRNIERRIANEFLRVLE